METSARTVNAFFSCAGIHVRVHRKELQDKIGPCCSQEDKGTLGMGARFRDEVSKNRVDKERQSDRAIER